LSSALLLLQGCATYHVAGSEVLPESERAILEVSQGSVRYVNQERSGLGNSRLVFAPGKYSLGVVVARTWPRSAEYLRVPFEALPGRVYALEVTGGGWFDELEVKIVDKGLRDARKN